MSRHDDHDGDHPKLSLSVDHETARQWLEGEGDQLATQTKIFNSCYRWLCLYRRGLTKTVLEDIVWTAMAEAFADFRSQQLSVYEALISLQKALNRLRAREDRRRRYEIPQSDQPLDRFADPQNDPEDIFDRDFWIQVARLIERHMMSAFLSLSDRDQDIIACSYGLQEIGDPGRQPIYPEFPSVDAEKKALSRARKRFNSYLESSVDADLELALEFNRPLYEAALRIIRGGKVHLVLTPTRPEGNS